MNNEIKEMRTQMQMSQREFAEFVDVPLSTYRKWEQGEAKPADYIVRMMSYYIAFKEKSKKSEGNMENETLETLMKRRSCRNFKPDMVEQEKLDAILKAGTYAATGMGKQAPIILAVTNKELRDQIAEENRKIGGWPEGFDPFYGAPVILIVLADQNIGTYQYDGSLVLGNLMNAAESLGVNSIWIHRAKEEFESEFGKGILADLGVKGDYVGIGHCALGYAATPVAEAAPRKADYVYYLR